MAGPRALLLALIMGVTLPALAASRSAAAQAEPPEVQFNSTGVGRVSVEPDFAVVVFSVRAISKTAQGAIGDNARNVDVLVKSLRAFAGSGDRIETAGFRLVPIAAGFITATDIQVRTTRVKDLGRLIDVGIKGGADEVASVGFGREHTREATQAAVQQAIAKARESAAAVAAGLGLRSVRILSIELSVEQPEGAMVLRDVAKATASSETAIQPGLLTLTVRVAIRSVLAP